MSLNQTKMILRALYILLVSAVYSVAQTNAPIAESSSADWDYNVLHAYLVGALANNTATKISPQCLLAVNRTILNTLNFSTSINQCVIDAGAAVANATVLKEFCSANVTTCATTANMAMRHLQNQCALAQDGMALKAAIIVGHFANTASLRYTICLMSPSNTSCLSSGLALVTNTRMNSSTALAPADLSCYTPSVVARK